MFKLKFVLACLITGLFNVNAFSQQLVDSYIFRTDFNDDDLVFSLSDNETEKGYCKDGMYHLQVKDVTKNYRVYYRVSVDTKQDFFVSAALKRTTGTASKGYGLCLGYKNIDNGFYFYITETGTYEIYKDENAKRKILAGPTKTDLLSKIGEFNNLMVEKKEDKLYFFINYKLATTLPYSNFAGSKYGIFVEGVQDVACDYMYVKQKREPINLIEGWDKFGVKTKLGPEVNSTAGEITPIVSADEKNLFVTRKSYNTDGKEGDDDVYYSTLGTDSNWKPLKNIGKPINNTSHNFVCGVSSDNNEIMLGGKYSPTGERIGQGFSRSHKTKNGWSMPKNLVIKNYYNDDDYVEMCPSHDFKTIIFAIRRNGDTYGGKDLYYSTMLDDSTWTEPVNLGKELNTLGEEDSPFLAPDNTTLYFSSDGWPGYGSNDIFVTKRLDNTWKHWSKPKNLGPVINSKKWDAYYTTSASGKYAYLVSNRSDANHADIYQVKQPETAKPDPVMLVKGTVYNTKTKEHVKATITYSILGSNKTLGHVNSSPDDGSFVITLPKGKKYAFTAHKDGFIAEHKSSDVIDLKNYKEEHVDLYITPFEKGESVIMHNLFFVADKFEILPESEAELSRLYELLKENKKVKVEIGGHTSLNKSSEKWNQDLSFNRAKAVKDYIVAKGIPEDRIIAKGYGHNKPLEKIMDEAHQGKNRRVEFTILEK